MRLYQSATCQYSFYVRSEFQNMGLVIGQDYELVDASRGTPGRDEVVRLGGQNQIPFLVDGEVRIYESGEIVEYAKRRKFS
ncbi:glutathione S-transferase N-terminal domain-containing protein [Leptospira sp. WS92.C1]